MSSLAPAEAGRAQLGMQYVRAIAVRPPPFCVRQRPKSLAELLSVGRPAGEKYVERHLSRR